MGVNIFSPSFILQVEKKQVIMTLPPTKWVKKLRNDEPSPMSLSE